MREFKEPYYTGPDCVCCNKPVVVELDDLGEQLVSGILKEERDAIIEIINQERREWGLGTLAERVLSNLAIRINLRNNNE